MIARERYDLSEMPAAWQSEHKDAFVDSEGRIGVDAGAIYVEIAAGRERRSTTAWSDGVTLPRRFLDEARAETKDPKRLQGYDITCGNLMATALGVSDSNWHGAFTGHSRDEILTHGAASLPLRIV